MSAIAGFPPGEPPKLVKLVEFKLYGYGTTVLINPTVVECVEDSDKGVLLICSSRSYYVDGTLYEVRRKLWGWEDEEEK